jgi:DNA-binding MarR family transcriptional regulator
MTTTSGQVAVHPETRAAIIAYLDALTLAEPIQTRLWQLGQITVTQVSVLRQLRDGPQTAGKLGQAVGLSPASLSHLLDRLERRNLVRRRRDSDDRRRVDVYLEPPGERLLGEAKVLRGSDIHLAIESMTSEERRKVTSGLNLLVDSARRIALQREERE